MKEKNLIQDDLKKGVAPAMFLGIATTVSL